MMWEALTAISTVATFLVIAASAVAAIVQLRHMNAGNQIHAAMSLAEKWSGPDYARGLEFIFDGGLDEKLKDPAFRADLERPPINRSRHPEAAVLAYWEQAGSLVKMGFIEEATFMNLSSLQCINV